MVNEDFQYQKGVTYLPSSYTCDVSRHNSLEKDIMLGTMPGTRRQGGQKRQWINNTTQWTEKGLVDIVRLAENREVY